MSFVDDLQANIYVSDFINLTIKFLAFVLGFYINTRIIYICVKEKDNKTRHLHMIYSISSSILYAFDIPFFVISNAVPNLSRYTGEWPCHIASFITIFSMYIIFMNSFWVASMKYFFILYWDKALKFGHAKVQQIFIIIALALPFSFTLATVFTKDFDAYKGLKSCYGIENSESPPADAAKEYFFCKLTMVDSPNQMEYISYVFIQAICISKNILTLPITTNLTEAILYYKIFKRMKR